MRMAISACTLRAERGKVGSAGAADHAALARVRIRSSEVDAETWTASAIARFVLRAFVCNDADRRINFAQLGHFGPPLAMQVGVYAVFWRV